MLITSRTMVFGSNFATTPPESAPLILFASAWLIMKPGMVGVPPPNAPSKGSPGATKPIMPADPPPPAMLLILTLKAQDPRSTSTIFPTREPAAKAAHPFLFPPALSPYCNGPWITEVSGADHGWKTAA